MGMLQLLRNTQLELPLFQLICLLGFSESQTNVNSSFSALIFNVC